MYRETNIYCRRESPPPPLCSKIVRFEEAENQVHVVLNRDEMTRDEHSACFFTDNEYNAIRQRERTLARNLAKTGSLKGLEEDALGLDTRRKKEYRRERMKECCMRVILEQDLQIEFSGCHDADGIARVLLEYSSYSSQLAYNRAYDNAIQVQETKCSSNTEEIGISNANTIDRPNSPRSTVEPLVYDFHAPCSNCPFDECPQYDEVAEGDRNWTESEKKHLLDTTEIARPKFLPSPPRMISPTVARSPQPAPPARPAVRSYWFPAPPPPPPHRRIVHFPPHAYPTSTGPVYYYFSMPPLPPWEQRWAHQYSQMHNARGGPPPQPSRWYIAE